MSDPIAAYRRLREALIKRGVPDSLTALHTALANAIDELAEWENMYADANRDLEDYSSFEDDFPSWKHPREPDFDAAEEREEERLGRPLTTSERGKLEDKFWADWHKTEDGKEWLAKLVAERKAYDKAHMLTDNPFSTEEGDNLIESMKMMRKAVAKSIKEFRAGSKLPELAGGYKR